MFRIDIVRDPIFSESMDQIRKLTPQLIQCMAQVALELQGMNARGQSLKRIPGKIVETIQIF